MNLNPAWTFDPTLEPVNPFAVLHDSDAVLRQECRAMHDALLARDPVGYARWLFEQHPILLRDAPLALAPARLWWLLAGRVAEVTA